MTGYGIAETTYQSKKITAEIKTLNSKQIDLQLKLPTELRAYEIDLRNRIGNKLQRGKIDAIITVTDTTSTQNAFDEAAVKNYVGQIQTICQNTGIAEPLDMATLVFRLPGVLAAPETQYDEEFVKTIEKTLDEALDKVDSFRIKEGEILKNDLVMRSNLIASLLNDVEPYEKSRHETIKQRILKNLSELTADNKYDENRFEQELIYYLEKLDITEEKVRLRQHCNYFNETCNDDQGGKKLGFIAQEMGREINTLGSKANEVDIQKIVVHMKDELEKIKEQVCNIL